MPSKTPDEPGAIRAPAQRVAAPPTQTKTRRLPPAYALAWLHLLLIPNFPSDRGMTWPLNFRRCSSAARPRPRRGPVTRSRPEGSRNRAGNAARADVDRRRRE